jgi:hypothetical protein
MRVNGEPVGKPRRGRPFTRAPYIACKVCNNGWMKDLEDRARPLLLPMLDGFKTVLDRTSQTVIAAWITKTAFSLAAVPSWMIGNRSPAPIAGYWPQAEARRLRRGSESYCRSTTSAVRAPTGRST